MKVRLVALVPVLGVLLAGCSSEEAPAQPPPLPSPTSVAPTPSGAAASVPAEAAAATPQGAAAFARYFYDELGRAFVEFDSAAVRRLSASSCTTCTGFADSMDKERTTGKRYSGTGYTVRVAEAVALDANRTEVSVVYDAATVKQVAGPGAPTAFPGRKGIAVRLELIRTGDSWLVARIEEQPA